MSKKAYEFTAAVLKANMPSPSSDEMALWVKMVNAFAAKFAAGNAKFKKGMFMVACGLND